MVCDCFAHGGFIGTEVLNAAVDRSWWRSGTSSQTWQELPSWPHLVEIYRVLRQRIAECEPAV